MSAGEGDENAVEAFSPRPFVGSEAPVHTLQKLQLGDNVQGQRVDSPPANPTHPQNEFELIIKPTQDDSLREITNIVRPQPLQEISKEYSGICSLGQGKTEEGGSALISPSMKSAILTARKRNLTVVDKDTLNRKYEEFLEQRKRIEEMKQKAKLKDVFITELLSFNKLSLFFGGDCFPGEVTEESLEVFNKGGVELTYKIHLVCKDDALNELDEYVFSMRKTGSFDYNDKYLVVQSPGVKSTYKIALKVPNTREACPIDGFVVVFSDDCKGKVNIPIKSKVLIPSLGSDRLLLKQGDLDGTLHFLIKNKKRQDLKVVLRNNSHRVFQAEFTSIADQYMGEHYELAFSPAVVNYPAFGLATLGLIVKSVTDDPNLASPQATMRCLLVAKVRNSSIKFTFRCEFQFVKPGYESSSCFE